MMDERAFIARLELASTDELARVLASPTADEERALHVYLGDERLYRKVRHNARKKIRIVFKEPRAPGENAGAENSHAQWSRRRHLSDRILDGLTGYGVQTKRLFAIALFIVSFGMLMFPLDNGLVEAEASASPAPPGGTPLASTAPAAQQSSYEQGRQLFRDLLCHLDLGAHGKLDGEAQAPTGWPVKPVNIAHRGGKGIAPENTLEGFREGLRVGADVLELEVHFTADDHLVVIHDDTVDRSTDGTGLVREMTLQEIKRLDAGYRFTKDSGKTYPYRGQGVAVPTLEEVYREFPDVPLNVEIKEVQRGIEQAVWQVIKEAKAEDRTLVNTGAMCIIRSFREASGGRVATGASAREIVVFEVLRRLHLSRLLRPSYQALQVPEKLPEGEKYAAIQIVTPQIVTPKFVRAVHELDLRVDVWTVNEEEDMRRFHGYGVDGIMTDCPDVLNGVLGGEGKDIMTDCPDVLNGVLEEEGKDR